MTETGVMITGMVTAVAGIVAHGVGERRPRLHWVAEVGWYLAILGVILIGIGIIATLFMERL